MSSYEEERLQEAMIKAKATQEVYVSAWDTPYEEVAKAHAHQATEELKAASAAVRKSESSNSDEDGAGYFWLLVGAAILFVLYYAVFFALTFAPIIFGVVLIILGWKTQATWVKAGWVASWFLVYVFFNLDIRLSLFGSLISKFHWTENLASSYIYLGFVALIVVLVGVSTKKSSNNKLFSKTSLKTKKILGMTIMQVSIIGIMLVILLGVFITLAIMIVNTL